MARKKTEPPAPRSVGAASRAAWRKWLEAHHADRSEVWLRYHKKHTGRASVTNPEAVEEALCFGWIDTTVRRIDADTWMQRFTPRRPGSAWSTVNRARFARLLAAGRVAPAGLARAPTEDTPTPIASWRLPDVTPPWLAEALQTDPDAWRHYLTLAPSHRKRYISWIGSAKQAATRARRIERAIRMLRENQKLEL